MAEENEIEEPQEAGEESSEGKQSSKKKLIIIAIAALVVIGGAAFGAMMFLGGGDESGSNQANVPHEHSESEPGEEQPPAQQAPAGEQPQQAANENGGTDADQFNFGKTVQLKPFHLNLGNPLENHYIRLEISVEHKGGDEYDAEINRRMPQLRDAAVSIVSKKSREFFTWSRWKSATQTRVTHRV